MLAMVAGGAALGWIYAQSRRKPGGWLLLASFPMRLVHWGVVAYSPMHLFETLAASFALVAGLFVILDEMREGRIWRVAALRFSAAMAAGGGAAEVERLCNEIAGVSGAVMVRLLEDDPVDAVKRRSAILPGQRSETALASNRKEHNPRGLLHLPLLAGSADGTGNQQRMGTLVLGFRRSLPGPPADMERSE